jgi:hypothetical protein
MQALYLFSYSHTKDVKTPIVANNSICEHHYKTELGYAQSASSRALLNDSFVAG